MSIWRRQRRASLHPVGHASDPDILLVGEIRDKDTAELAIEAALTGHQVLSTIHTPGRRRSSFASSNSAFQNFMSLKH